MDFAKSFKGKRVLVTGHTGFKGSWLCEWLLSLGAQVSGYSIDVPTTPSLFETLGLKKRMNDLRADVRDYSALVKVFDEVKPEVVFHLAAQPLVRASYDDPKLTFDTNTGGTVNVLEAIRHSKSVKAAVIVTTDKVYENTEQGSAFREDEPLGGHDPYSASKAAAEIVFSSYARSFFLGAHPKAHAKIASARAGNVIGGGDWAVDRIVPDCARSWSKAEMVRIRNPDSVRPYQHVIEPVGAYLKLAARLLENPTAVHGESFNFGPKPEGARRTIELVEALEKHWPGASHTVQPLLDGKKEAGYLMLSIEKAAEVLQWAPKLDFSTTAAWTAEWYASYSKSGEKTAREITLKQIEAYAKML